MNIDAEINRRDIPAKLEELLTPSDRENLTDLASYLETLPLTFSLTQNDGRSLEAVLDPGTLPEIRKKLWTYMAWILGRGHQLNLTAITGGLAMYEKHILDSLSLLPLVDNAAGGSKAVLVDVGTGAGLPGLILAIMRPELNVVLNDSLKKRLNFIDEVIADLGLQNAVTVHARAEDLGRDPAHRERADIAVARAVAALPVLAEYCLPLVKQGGVWLAPKTLSENPADMRQALKHLGGGRADTWLPPSNVEGETEYAIYAVKKTGETPRRYPRKPSQPAKNPL